MKHEFTFTTILESVKLNLFTAAVYLPHHIIIELPKGRLRISGTLNGAPFSLAIQYKKDGSRFFTVGAALRKAANVQPGDNVDVNFKILTLTKVEMPEPLEVIVLQDSELRKIGKKFSKPERQSLGEYIAAVKNMDSRLKKSIEKVQRSKVGAFQTQPNRKNKNK